MYQKNIKGWIYMSVNRRKDILKRIEKRKKQRALSNNHNDNNARLPKANDIYGRGFNSTGSSNKLLWNETLLFRLLIAAVFFLIITIAYKTPNQNDFTTAIKKTTNMIMKEEFNFAYAKAQIEKIFGNPEIAILPFGDEKKDNLNVDNAASGKVVETFSVNGKGIIIETIASYQVRSLKKGVILFAGTKKDLGNTVVVQGEDGTEFWYGKLEDINVSQYDSVDEGELIGKVSSSDSDHVGKYYFAIKKSQGFIDPTQVIKFE
jgi:stage IV sporulation protein FA